MTNIVLLSLVLQTNLNHKFHPNDTQTGSVVQVADLGIKMGTNYASIGVVTTKIGDVWKTPQGDWKFMGTWAPIK